jgi:uncharacterized iron-regulated membrane protein
MSRTERMPKPTSPLRLVLRYIQPRAWIQFVHLWTSLLLGTVVLAIMLSGTLLMFRAELEPIIYRDLYQVSSGSPVPLDDVIKAVQKTYPKVFVEDLELPAMTHGAIRVNVKDFTGPSGRVFVDPNSGKVNGFQAVGSSLFDWLVLLHTKLFWDAGYYAGGRLVGFVGLALVLMLLTGLVLWIPRITQWKHAFALRRKNAFIWNHDVHKLVGFLVMVPLIAIISVIFPTTFYQDANDALANIGYPRGAGAELRPYKSGSPATLEQLVRTAEGIEVGAQAVRVKPGSETKVRISSRDDVSRNTGKFQGDLEITLGRDTGRIVTVEDTRKWGVLARAIDSPLRLGIHMGTWGGWLTRLLEFLVSLGTLYLAWTGVQQWWIKRGLRNKSKRKARAKSVESLKA